MKTAKEINDLTEKIIACAIRVHRELGPGLLESTYEVCLKYEFEQLGILVERRVPVAVIYRGVKLEKGYWIDLLVERTVVLELKSQEGILPVHEAQLVSYLRLSGYVIGLLLNFNVRIMKDGIRRIVNGLPE